MCWAQVGAECPASSHPQKVLPNALWNTEFEKPQSKAAWFYPQCCYHGNCGCCYPNLHSPPTPSLGSCQEAHPRIYILPTVAACVMPRLVLDLEHAGKELLSWPQATVTGSGIGTWHNLGQWDCTLNFPEICKERYHLSSEKLPDSFLTSTLQMRTRKLTAWSSDSDGAYSQERQRRTELKRNKIPDDWSAESHQTWGPPSPSLPIIYSNKVSLLLKPI